MIDLSEINFTANIQGPEFVQLLDQLDHDIECIRRSERLRPEDIEILKLWRKTGSRGMYRIDLNTKNNVKRLMRVERWENNRPNDGQIRVVTVVGSVIL
jgi:pyruvate/2-oxoglutarate dehydrogenase complex dihydrolipoamide dehydrogenase (E3) component